MKAYRIKGKLIKRIKNIYKETVNRVSVENKRTDKFWTERGLKQGCSLSPLLFVSIYSRHGMEDYIRKKQNGGVNIGRKRIYTLAYADDLAMIAETKKEMEYMQKLERFKKFFNRRKLTLNIKNSKILSFSRKERRNQERKWK